MTLRRLGYYFYAIGTPVWYLFIIYGMPQFRPGLLEAMLGVGLGYAVGRIIVPFWITDQLARRTRPALRLRLAEFFRSPGRNLIRDLRCPLIVHSVVFVGVVAIMAVLFLVHVMLPDLGLPVSLIAYDPEMPSYSLMAAMTLYIATLMFTVAVICLRDGRIFEEEARN